MLLDQILAEARTLPEAAWPELAMSIKARHFKYRTQDDTRPVVRSLDALKGGLRFMSEGFDETPSCFEEYV